ncbi:cytochrome P450 [Talaromyces proteolyticus]|uniref:Cytochrome P450 n=1 Tax=Talaromyces proteolyticus TaxID=1131652 RepID=A0AAD4KTK7_9EURO|nr:cytochrome P450 [Talaromyces proteolyticus]KAH8699008.1 cytochrome P450 [Talaromyces proteolyticus]
MSISVFTLTALCAALYYTIAIAYNLLINPLRHIPGPKLYAISHLPILRRNINGTWCLYVSKLHEKYGPVIRVSPNEVLFISPSAWNTIWRSKGTRSFEKDPLNYPPTLTGVDNMLIANSKAHLRMRRALNPAFTDGAILEQERDIQKFTNSLVSKLKQKAASGTPIDMQQWFSLYTFDLVGKLLYSRPFGCLQSEEHHPYVAMIYDLITMVPYLSIFSRLTVFQLLIKGWNMDGLTWLARYFIPKKTYNAFKELLMFTFYATKESVHRRDTRRRDWISYFLRNNGESTMSVDELGETSAILFIAGSESVASTVTSTLWFLMQNPISYQTLVEEIRTSFRDESEITITALKKLPYLTAVLEETMRLRHPTPPGFARTVPKDGAYIDGYFIPENTKVSINSMAANTSPLHFNHPHKYAPERWLRYPGFENDQLVASQPFYAGPRDCIGKGLAWAEMRVLISKFFWNFDVELLPESSGWDQQKVYIIWEKKPLWVKLAPVKKG